MTRATYHLAQLNVARMAAPTDAPEMAEFMANLEPINALADQSPGFIWRLKTDEGDATGSPTIRGDFSNPWQAPKRLARLRLV